MYIILRLYAHPLKYNFATYFILTWLNVLNFQLNYKFQRYEFEVQNIWWKKCIHKCWLLLQGVHYLSLVWKLAKIALFCDNVSSDTDTDTETSNNTFQRYYKPAATLICAGLGLTHCINYIFTFQWPGLNVLIFREIQSEIVAQGGNLKTKNSIQDVVLSLLPISIFCLIGVIPCSYAYDPFFPIFLYSSVPTKFAGPLFFLLCLAIDIFLYFSILAPIYHFGFMVFAFFRHLNSRIANTEDRLFSRKLNSINSVKTPAKWARAVKERGLQSMRELQLLINLFNLAFGNIIFLGKSMCLVSAIMGGHIGIKFQKSDGLISMCFLLIAIDAMFLFVVIYDKAFKFPGKLASIKRRALVHELGSPAGFHCFGDGNNSSRKISEEILWERHKRYRVTIKSFSFVGIQVGIFNKLGRLSTPSFVDYVTKQVARSLLTLKQ